MTSVPDARYFDNGTPKNYDWTLDEAGLYGLGYKVSNPPAFNLGSPAKFRKFTEDHDNSFIFWFFPESIDDSTKIKYEIYNKVARDYQHTPFYFGQAIDPEVRKSERIRFSDMPIVRMYGIDEAYDYNVTAFTEESLRQFIESHKFGHVYRLDTAQWRVIHRELSNKPIVLLIAVVDIDDEEQRSKYIGPLRIAAWDNRLANNFNFQMAYVDRKQFPELAEQYGVTKSPALIAVDFRSGKHTIAPDNLRLEVRVDLTRFMLNIWNNRTILQSSEKELDEGDVIQVEANPEAMKNYAILGVALVVFFIASIKMCASPPAKSEKAPAAKSKKSRQNKSKKD